MVLKRKNNAKLTPLAMPFISDNSGSAYRDIIKSGGITRQFVQSVDLLQGHHREIVAAADNALALINSCGRGLVQPLAKLWELDRHAHL